MKKTIILLFSTFLFISASSQIDFRFKGIGAGLSLGSNAAWNDNLGSSMGIGINVLGLAQLTEKIDAEAALVYFFPSEPVEGYSFRLLTFSLNGRYYFYNENLISAYGLAGLNFSNVKVEYPSFSVPGFELNNGGSDSNTEVGLNIGIGGSYELTEMLDGTAQIGYTVGDADQLFIHLGVLYKF